MHELEGLQLAPNWTTAASALQGVLTWLGGELPQHAVMGLSGHAWHVGISSRAGVHVLPDGPANLDWGWMVEGYERLGVQWERYSDALAPGADWAERRQAAIEWVIARLDEGRPVIGWDFHLHEFAIVYGYNRARQGFLVQSVLTPDVGPFAPWEEWPSSLGLIELFTPADPAELEAEAAIAGALEAAAMLLAGEPASPSWSAGGDPSATVARGADAFDRWAELLDGEEEIDRAGNAYVIAVTQAAREDGARFLADLARAVPDIAAPLQEAERALHETVRAMSPLVTLFPFPAGGHGNIDNPGLRRAAAMPLRRCATYDRQAAAALRDARARL